MNTLALGQTQLSVSANGVANAGMNEGEREREGTKVSHEEGTPTNTCFRFCFNQTYPRVIKR